MAIGNFLFCVTENLGPEEIRSIHGGDKILPYKSETGPVPAHERVERLEMS